MKNDFLGRLRRARPAKRPRNGLRCGLPLSTIAATYQLSVTRRQSSDWRADAAVVEHLAGVVT